MLFHAALAVLDDHVGHEGNGARIVGQRAKAVRHEARLRRTHDLLLVELQLRGDKALRVSRGKIVPLRIERGRAGLFVQTEFREHVDEPLHGAAGIDPEDAVGARSAAVVGDNGARLNQVGPPRLVAGAQSGDGQPRVLVDRLPLRAIHLRLAGGHDGHERIFLRGPVGPFEIAIAALAGAFALLCVQRTLAEAERIEASRLEQRIEPVLFRLRKIAHLNIDRIAVRVRSIGAARCTAQVRPRRAIAGVDLQLAHAELVGHPIEIGDDLFRDHHRAGAVGHVLAVGEVARLVVFRRPLTEIAGTVACGIGRAGAVKPVDLPRLCAGKRARRDQGAIWRVWLDAVLAPRRLPQIVCLAQDRRLAVGEFLLLLEAARPRFPCAALASDAEVEFLGGPTRRSCGARVVVAPVDRAQIVAFEARAIGRRRLDHGIPIPVGTGVEFGKLLFDPEILIALGDLGSRRANV